MYFPYSFFANNISSLSNRDSLLAYYSFAYGNISGDMLGVYNLTNVQGTPLSCTGVINSGYYATGAGNPAMYTDNTFNLSCRYNNGFTVAGWIDIIPGHTVGIGGYQLINKTFEYRIIRNNALLYRPLTLDVYTNIGIKSITGFAPFSGFQFIAFRYHSGNNSIYLNITNTGYYSLNLSGAIPSTGNEPFEINQRLGSMVSRYDEIGIWNRYLTDSELTYLYNNGTGRTYPFT